MAGKDDLGEAFARLASVTTQPPMTRGEWVDNFQTISLHGLTVATPGVDAESLDLRVRVARIGSFWFRDEECHVYAMEQALLEMIKTRERLQDRDFSVVTPIWVFYRCGNRAKIMANPEALAVANRNFLRFFDEAYARHKTNG